VPVADRALFEPPSFDRQAVARRRELEAKVSAFRRAEAKRRDVDEQVVLPGHCATELVSILMSSEPRDPQLPTRVAAIAGIGTKRAEHYAEALAGLLDAPAIADVSITADEDDDA
jgi:ribonuclease D